ncbi:hypothetical protein E5S70_32885 [Ensifer adhaerens]|nr:hypothetical protein [Ensifer canadensis]
MMRTAESKVVHLIGHKGSNPLMAPRLTDSPSLVEGRLVVGRIFGFRFNRLHEEGTAAALQGSVTFPLASLEQAETLIADIGGIDRRRAELSNVPA